MPALIYAGYYIGSVQKRDTPPHLGSDKCLLPPKFFAPKIQQKVSLPLGKKFRKKFARKCFGVKESPQCCGKGARGAKI